MEVTAGLGDGPLDLILHSPGGSPEAAGGVVSYLRSRFRHIRVIVPNLAMSAATMIACGANEILMGKHSFLGPIDPQIPLHTALGTRYVAAGAILDQFEKAKKDCQVPSNNLVWQPMLSQYGPDLLVQCEAALALSKELVGMWLREYMFAMGGAAGEATERAAAVADWLADHSKFKSHSRHISRSQLREQGLAVFPLEKDEVLQDLSLSVFHAATHAFGATPAVKIVENHLGRAFIKYSPPAGPGQ